MFTVSATIRAGTTTPTEVTLFKDYIDVARFRPAKYIYLQSKQNVTITQSFETVPGTVPTPLHVLINPIDKTDKSNMKLVVPTTAFSATVNTVGSVYSQTE